MLLYNSLTRKKEEFVPISPPNVGMYTCGPTVHDFVHIGNLRAYVFNDTLKRVLLANGYKVKHVANITDVDDKIIKKANETGVAIGEFTKKYTDAFFEDIKKLNIIPADFYPKATEYIPQMIQLVQALLDRGVAYKAEDGSVYFSIERFPKYGQLSRLDKRQIKPGARVAADEYTKENVQDFALWKAAKEGEPTWDAPFGQGRPGWHVECSAMSMDILGQTFDIHTGGVDLLFPHHEDEIAQSEAATGKPFAKYWVHNEHLLVDGKKMSKSLGNFYTLADVETRGVNPIALRYLYLTAHYRDPLNFTWESLSAAQSALERLRDVLYNLKFVPLGPVLRLSSTDGRKDSVQTFKKLFLDALNDDLSTPRALAVLWDSLKSSLTSGDKVGLLAYFDEVLGLGLAQLPVAGQELPVEVEELVKEREELRKQGKWEEADKLRERIEEAGYTLEDTAIGPRIRKTKLT